MGRRRLSSEHSCSSYSNCNCVPRQWHNGMNTEVLCCPKRVNHPPDVEKWWICQEYKWFMVEHRDLIVTPKISPWLVACKPCHQQIVIYFGGIKLAFHFGYGWKIFGYHGSIFWTVIPSNFVPWLLTQFACDNIDINYSNLVDENIPMLCAKHMNFKLSINLSLYADSTGGALHAGSRSDTRISSDWGDFG